MKVRISNASGSVKCIKCGKLMAKKWYGYKCRKCGCEQLNKAGREYLIEMKMVESIIDYE